MAGDGRWLTVGEACRVLGVSRTTLLAAEETGAVVPIRTPGGHRRYAAAELRRHLGGSVPGPEPRPAPAADPAALDDAAVAATVRAAVRPLAHALDAECAGLYRCHAGDLRFAGAFGVPRWLAERLADAPPPAAVAAALGAVHARPFDPAATGFPDPRSAGHGAAVGLHAEGRPLGLLFLVARPGPGPLPAELRVVDAFAEVLALLLASLARTAEAEGRLSRIAALTRG